MRILLASQSPRRRFLLESVGYHVDCVAPLIDEMDEVHDKSIDEVVLYNAYHKAQKVYEHPPHASWDILVAADTVVVLGDEIFGKPHNQAQAHVMLRRLSKQTHQVITGFFLKTPAGLEYSTTVTSKVAFRALIESEITAYLSKQESSDKAGAYAVQGAGAALISRIEGSLTNIIGLPLEEVLHHAQRLLGRIES